MSTRETEHTLMTISAEYVALVGSFLFVGLEAFIRILTLALRESTCSLKELQLILSSYINNRPVLPCFTEVIS
jgi:hypothetical protein